MLGKLRRTLIAAVVIAAGLAGCAHRAGSGPTAVGTMTLPPAHRGRVESQIERLPTAPAAGVDAQPFPTPPYRALTASQAQCLAAAHAPLARLHMTEGGAAGRFHRRSSDLRRDVLAYTAEEIQNRSAGAALELYYRIAEAEGKADILNESLAALDAVIKETRDLIARALKPPVPLDVWEQQSLRMRADKLQAQMTIDQLNGELRALIGVDDGERWRVWNPERYDVTDAAVDVEAAVCDGVARRPELSLLRRLTRDLSPATLDAAADMMRSLSPLLGAGGAGCPCLSKIVALLALRRAGRGELEQRRGQLTDYLGQREAAVAEEVRQAAAALVYRGRIVALSWERERWREKNLRDIRGRQQQGLASFAEVASTMLEWHKARAEVVQEVMAWHIAGAKLRQAQGTLAAECSSGDCAAWPRAASIASPP